MKNLKLVVAILIIVVTNTVIAKPLLPLCEQEFCENLENIGELCDALHKDFVPITVDPQTSCKCDCGLILPETTETVVYVNQKDRVIRVLPTQVQADSNCYWCKKVTGVHKYKVPPGWIILEAEFEETKQNGHDTGIEFLNRQPYGFDLLSDIDIRNAYNAAIDTLLDKGLPENHPLIRKMKNKREAHRKARFNTNIGFGVVEYAIYADGYSSDGENPAKIEGHLKLTEQYVGNSFSELQAAIKQYVNQELAKL